MKIQPRHEQDESGQWWYRMKNGGRARCTSAICKTCGEEFLRFPSHKTEHCSRACAGREVHSNYSGELRGARAMRWNGGRRVHETGYVLIFAPDHPSLAGTKRIYVAEHRLVMEKKLGRLLESWERVHHINGVRHDNDPGNLELWKLKSAHPGGIREADYHCSGCRCGD